MPHINGDAPSTPNVFTDGSVIRGNDQLTALGTYGAWHVKRTAHTPITIHERYVTEHHQTIDGGLELYGCLYGEAISPGRTETAGALLAALAPFPTNIAIDNQSTVTTANAIHDQTIDLHRWPWALRKTATSGRPTKTSSNTEGTNQYEPPRLRHTKTTNPS